MAKSLVLTGISGSRVGLPTVVSSRLSIIGSGSGCDVMLHDRQVLPNHAEIRVLLDRWFIVPLDAGALVFVNGVPVRGKQRIDEGDLVTVGTATFKAAIQEVNEVGGPRRW
ncbi:FHA domain-containing protein [Chloroflexales bacterium ZM16-3]|nr:FHA domain-containing protein [Chloroflexales bacterium ZM16-3]